MAPEIHVLTAASWTGLESTDLAWWTLQLNYGKVSRVIIITSLSSDQLLFFYFYFLKDKLLNVK